MSFKIWPNVWVRFPAAKSCDPAIDYEPLDLPYEPSDEELSDTDQTDQASGGDWRKALENIRSSSGLAISGSRSAS